MVEPVLLPMGKISLMYNADVQCKEVGEREAKEQKKKIMFKFFLSCDKIGILFQKI